MHVRERGPVLSVLSHNRSCSTRLPRAMSLLHIAGAAKYLRLRYCDSMLHVSTRTLGYHITIEVHMHRGPICVGVVGLTSNTWFRQLGITFSRIGTTGMTEKFESRASRVQHKINLPRLIGCYSDRGSPDSNLPDILRSCVTNLRIENPAYWD
jgi:hypothetical protein